MKSFRIALVGLMVLIFTTQGLAKEWTHASGFKFDLPDNYKVETNDDLMVATDKSAKLVITFLPAKNAAELKEALRGAQDYYAKKVPDIKFEDSEKYQN